MTQETAGILFVTLVVKICQRSGMLSVPYVIEHFVMIVLFPGMEILFGIVRDALKKNTKNIPKLYRVIRDYRHFTIYEMVYATSKKEVYQYLDWEKQDKPKLKIKEIPVKPGCFFSISHKEYKKCMTFYKS